MFTFFKQLMKNFSKCDLTMTNFYRYTTFYGRRSTTFSLYKRIEFIIEGHCFISWLIFYVGKILPSADNHPTSYAVSILLWKFARRGNLNDS